MLILLLHEWNHFRINVSCRYLIFIRAGRVNDGKETSAWRKTIQAVKITSWKYL